MTSCALSRAVVVGIAALVMPLIATPASAQISVIVSASQSKSLTEQQIAEIFAGASTTWPDGTKVQIVENGDAVLTQKFFAKVVKKPTALVRSQWTKLALSGQGAAPKKGADAAAVKDYVKRMPGAIGYIATSDLDDSVKEIFKVP
ncbi:MAG: substrate-binding domain-containing protein [Gemmatimonadaceae bacterium]|nr:substrate-binding domain-containing protein [Gemmatimonadaceae bacterium]